MTEPLLRPDPEKVLARLKDFQRKTVDYAYRRLYTDPDAVRRFLVADEVGLGKTLVARGVIARAVDALWNETERIDIIYICSSSAIARQNITKLNVFPDLGDPESSRITLLPLTMPDTHGIKVNYQAFTPGTSLDLKGQLGMAQERALLHVMLSQIWELRGVGPMNALQGEVAHASSFRDRIARIGAQPINRAIVESFGATLAKTPELRQQFDELTTRFSRDGKRANRSPEDLAMQRKVIGTLRGTLARTCLDALQPDLIILDEFQRFKHLLDADDEESELARQLFDYTDHETTARVLLLSATPYKMFTTQGEAGEEDHYTDFVETIKFLQNDPVRTARVELLLGEFRRGLFRLEDAGLAKLEKLKDQLGAELRRVMVRTERLAVSPNRDGMLTQVPVPLLPVTASALHAYQALDSLAVSVDHHDPVEYWKSAPYLLSFMEAYALKHDVEEELGHGTQDPLVRKLLDRDLRLTLPWEEIGAYGQIDPANARMAWLFEQVLTRGAWRLLWIPPACPWYRLEGAYAEPQLKAFTKHLIFSSWHVVPKAIASLVSYEAERRAHELDGGERVYSREEQRAVPLLRFAEDSGAALLSLIYPSFVLSELGGTLRAESGQRMPSLEEALTAAEAKLVPLLDALPTPAGAKEDEAWYWAAPALLDRVADQEVTLTWLEDDDPADWWLGEVKKGEEVRGGVFERVHFAEFVRVVRSGGKGLGRRPADLVRHLALLTLAGPANVSLQGLASTVQITEPLKNEELRAWAGETAWSLRSYFNLPEAIAVVRHGDQQVPYWRKVLIHCAEGGLGAVLEEYSHVLTEWLGVSEAPGEDPAASVAGEMEEAIGIRTANVGLDDAVLNDDRVELQSRRMRSRFAVRLTEEKEDGSEGRQRLDQVRSAFNSPFWPFVLATTSVGQEGLDFHLYSHAVVHWNLPSNPVDLEQREGRVHRFKGHAVRKNVATKHGAEVAPTGTGDHWQDMFEAAKAARPGGCGDLWPYWIYPIEGGATIERHVPALPLSRDIERYARLRRSLTLYRMVFGQPRQDDLLEYLTRTFTPEEAQRQADALRLDLSPP